VFAEGLYSDSLSSITDPSYPTAGIKSLSSYSGFDFPQRLVSSFYSLLPVIDL